MENSSAVFLINFPERNDTPKMFLAAGHLFDDYLHSNILEYGDKFVKRNFSEHFLPAAMGFLRLKAFSMPDTLDSAGQFKNFWRQSQELKARVLLSP